MAHLNYPHNMYNYFLKARLLALSAALLALCACATSTPVQSKTNCNSLNQKNCTAKQMVTERVIIEFINEKNFDQPNTILSLENISGAKISFIQPVGGYAAVYLVQGNDEKHLGEAITKLKQQTNRIFKYVEIDEKMTIQRK